MQGAIADLTNISSRAGNAYFSTVALSSGTQSMFAVVSTALVNSNSLIFYSVQAGAGPVDSANLPASPFCVACISPQGFFRIQSVNSVAAIGSATVQWELKNPA